MFIASTITSALPKQLTHRRETKYVVKEKIVSCRYIPLLLERVDVVVAQKDVVHTTRPLLDPPFEPEFLLAYPAPLTSTIREKLTLPCEQLSAGVCKVRSDHQMMQKMMNYTVYLIG